MTLVKVWVFRREMVQGMVSAFTSVRHKIDWCYVFFGFALSNYITLPWVHNIVPFDT